MSRSPLTRARVRLPLLAVCLMAVCWLLVPSLKQVLAKRANSAVAQAASEQTEAQAEARAFDQSIANVLKQAEGARRVQALLELSEPALAEAAANSATNAQAALQTQARKIEAEQQHLAEVVTAPPYRATELYRVQKALNAVAVEVDAEQLSALRKLPGVKRASLLGVETTQTANAASTAPLGAPPALQTQSGGPGEVNVQVPPGSAAQRGNTVQVLVELNDAPAARVYAQTLRAATGTTTQVRNAAAVATRNQVTLIRAAQQTLGTRLAAAPIGAREIYRVQRAFNGIAVLVAPNQLDAIRKLPGVRDVHPIEMEFPSTSTSVPFLGTPNVWGNTLGLPSGYTGTGIKIGIIDTGIDYQHANFGGTGALADYQANDRTVITESGNASFPTAKVVGGYDFSGDAYTGNNAPVPDPDPMDCLGHGTHVAGIAAGYGVNSDGTTYTGPFDNSAPFGTLRIGPGTAPQASLYALRVFGCGGGTTLTVQAIDWAVDPNGDNDLSDHLDVINMSLGSNYGQLSSTSTMASENASLAGVIVAAASGNAGDTYFITSSPANSGRSISVAASQDSGIAGAGMTINSPAGIAGNYAVSASNSFAPTPAPGPNGQTANIVLALDPADGAGPLTTDGCTALTNAAAVAGNIALIDRGTCGFQVKANNAQAAGAIAVIIANNVVGDPNFIAMGATGTTPVTIPALFISLADRNTIVNNAPVNATLSAATAADTIASFSSRGARIGSPNVLKPDITAPGFNITSAQTGVTCTAASAGCLVPNASGFIASSQALTISGTSMATPHIAGIMALLRQEHPTWTVEELKALVMNTALHDITIGSNGGGLKYGPGRVGAGRVDPSLAAQSNVVAFNADDAGLVSLSFPGEVTGTQTFIKKLRLVNKGSTPVTYDLGLTTVVDAAGVSFSLPGGNAVTVPAGASVTLDVQMNANAALMNHTREATVAPGQVAPAPLAGLGTLARHWLTEEASYLNLSISGTAKLRVPLYSSVRPASMMSAPATIVTGGNSTGSTTIPLSGQDVCTGTLSVGPTCTGTFPTTEESLVTPFELQVVSPRNTVNSPDYADIKAAGVAYNGSVLMFGVTSYGDWATPAQVSYNIYIDNDNNGTYDRILFNSDPGNMSRNLFGNAGAAGQDSFLTAVFTIATSGVATQQFLNRVGAAGVDSAVFNTNVMFLAATPASLGITPGNTFKYKIVTCPGSQPLCLALNNFDYDEANGPYIFNTGAQGLNFSGANLADDLNGSTLPVAWNTANMTANGSLGALLLHHHNARGKRDEIVVLDTAQNADLAVSKSVSNPNPAFGQSVTFTITATNNGPNNATGVAVTDLLPSGLNYVSDDGGGAYSSSTGLWTVGALANGASATLHITATVNTTDPLENTAAITDGTPLDTNPANNQATLTLMAPRSADLALQMNVSSPTVSPGSAVTYTLTVTNNGGDPAYSLSIPESFPAFPALTPGSFTASQGVFNPATGFWNLASLGKGGSATLTYTVTAPNTAGALTSSATGSSNTSDPNTANNTASATTTVLSPADVRGTKTVAGTFLPGSNVTYTIVLTNNAATAQQDNPGNEFTDVLPGALTLVSANASSGTANANVGTNTVTWNGSIPGGGSVTITITATTNAAPNQLVSNQGTINYDADGNGTNEASRLTDDPSVGGASDPTNFTVPCTANPVVVNNNDSGAGSLRQAIVDACAGSTITFAANVTGTITLTSGDLIIDKNLTIQGPGAQTLTISGNNAFRVFYIADGLNTVTIAGLNLINGNGNGISFSGQGGAIYNANQGTTTLREISISGSSAFLGGAIEFQTNSFSSSSTILNLIRSTLSGNTATASSGAGGIDIRGNGTLNVVNSTIAGNQGGGIRTSVGGINLIVNLVNSTLASNQGEGLKLIGSMNFANVRNTVLTLNSGGDLALFGGAIFVSNGYNIFGTGIPGGAVQPTDQVGVNPLFELDGSNLPKLAFNGGPTQTIKLLPGSPAIDKGAAANDPSTNQPLTTDQRGQARPFDIAAVSNANSGNGSDIGAFEVQCSTITLAALPGGVVNTPYTQNNLASGGTAPYTLSLTGGALPPGVTINGNGLTGTPTLNGTFSFTLTATDGYGCTGSQSYTVAITCPTIVVSPGTLPSGQVGTAYNQTLTAAPAGLTYSFAVTSGVLPPGLTLASNGLLSGTPSAGGSYSFAITASGPGTCKGTQSYNLLITATCGTVTVNPASLPGGTVGTAYNQTVSATGGTAPYTFSVSAGVLPTGLTLDANTGVISGTPTAGGTFIPTIKATGQGGCVGQRTYVISVACGVVTINPATLPAATAGVAYSQQLTANVAGTFTLQLGSLPPGLSLTSAGLISGTTTQTGSFNITVKVTAGTCSGTRAYTLTVNAATFAVRAALAQLADYDGDGKADPALWTAGSGRWSILRSSNQQALEASFGAPGDVTLLGDYDGDGKTDLAVFRPRNGTFYFQRSSDGQLQTQAWGTVGDVPVPGDYDGDGKTDIAIWRPADGNWYVLRSSDGQYTVTAWGAGFAPYNDSAVPGDYDGDGKTDLAVFRRATGTWLVKLSHGRGNDSGYLVKVWGAAGDVPVPADYDGDGQTDIAVWRSGTWYIWPSASASVRTLAWGADYAPYFDQAVPFDYDGDGQADVAVWRAAEGRWYIRCSLDGSLMMRTQAQNSAAPVAARQP